jgi:hypothetical protein
MLRCAGRRFLGLALVACVILAVPAGAAAKKPPKPSPQPSPSSGVVGSFSFGELRADSVGKTGCGTNIDGEPAIHVSHADNVFISSEEGLGGGSDAWRGLGAIGGSGASGCGLEYRGQPNAVVPGVGASGGDTDLAVAPALNSSGNYNLYIASLNLGSVNVANSTDNGSTFSQVPVVGGLPLDDREWIASFGASTALLTYHDIATNNIDVLRSDDGGNTFTQTSRVIPDSDYKAGANELGNLVIDHRNSGGAAPGQFWAYQSFVAPSSSDGSDFNEAFVGVSNDGGATWTDKPIPCSTSNTGLDHIFPNVSVAPDGTLWYAWSNDRNVFTAMSSDHGDTWTCSSAVSTNSAQAVMPWLVATSAGVDLVYYASPTAPGPKANQTFYVYFAQNLTGTPGGWGTPQQLVPVHQGGVCEGGISCNGGRQLLDDFGVDTDSHGYAHIAYSHDAPDLGGDGTYTGYAVQAGGTTAGFPN